MGGTRLRMPGIAESSVCDLANYDMTLGRGSGANEGNERFEADDGD